MKATANNMKTIFMIGAMMGFMGIHHSLVAQNSLVNQETLLYISSGAMISVKGSFLNDSGKVVNQGLIEIEKNWNNQGIYQAEDTGTVAFIGEKPSVISGSTVGNDAFQRLSIRKKGTLLDSLRVDLTEDIEVNAQLALMNGRFVTGENNIKVNNPNTTAIVGHAQAGTTSSGYIEGNLIRAVTSLNSWYDFPVGMGIREQAVSYQLAKMRFQDLDGIESVNMRFISKRFFAPDSQVCGNIYGCVPEEHGFWLPSANGNPKYDLIAVPRNFLPGCRLEATYKLMKDGSMAGIPCQTFTGKLDPDEGTEVPAYELEGFAPIALTSTLYPDVVIPPVSHLQAIPLNRIIELNWSIEGGNVLEGFELQRSIDNRIYETLNWTPDSLPRPAKRIYKFEDETAVFGVKYYYRLKNISIDNTFEYSSTVTAILEMDAPFLLTKAYPIPANEQLTIELDVQTSQNITAMIFDGKGRIAVKSEVHLIAGMQKIELDVKDLPQGLYHLILGTSPQAPSVRFSILR